MDGSLKVGETAIGQSCGTENWWSCSGMYRGLSQLSLEGDAAGEGIVLVGVSTGEVAGEGSGLAGLSWCVSALSMTMTGFDLLPLRGCSGLAVCWGSNRAITSGLKSSNTIGSLGERLRLLTLGTGLLGGSIT